MKLSDRLALLAQGQGVTVVHAVTGGGVVHILDSMRSAGMDIVFYNNEQAAAFGAVAAAKVTGSIACCVVTTGPGGTNALTGLASAWVDSQPVLFLSGQARVAHMSKPRGVRQTGTQELDIVSPAATLSKSATTLTDAASLDAAFADLCSTAMGGRPGPVWLDLPLDLQWAEVDDSTPVPARVPPAPDVDGGAVARLDADVSAWLASWRRARRPAFLLGGGLAASARARFADRLEAWGVPYVLTYTSLERVDARTSRHNHGVAGIAGRRSANAALDNADHVTVIGSHLPVPITGSDTDGWCRGADVTLVNIDAAELRACRVPLAQGIVADAEDFCDRVLAALDADPPEVDREWSDWSAALARYEEARHPAPAPAIDLYEVLAAVSTALEPQDAVIVDGGGTVNAAAFSTLRPHATTRIIMSSGMCAMGSGLPEAVGSAAVLSGGQGAVILLVGDGSLQFNLQELATVHARAIPLRVFVISNGGYSSIRSTQRAFLDGRELGVSADSGLWFPDLAGIAALYGLGFARLDADTFSGREVDRLLHEAPAPLLVEVVVDPHQSIAPTQGFREISPGRFAPRPLSDMDPPAPVGGPPFDRWTKAET